MFCLQSGNMKKVSLCVSTSTAGFCPFLLTLSFLSKRHQHPGVRMYSVSISPPCRPLLHWSPSPSVTLLITACCQRLVQCEGRKLHVFHFLTLECFNMVQQHSEENAKQHCENKPRCTAVFWEVNEREETWQAVVLPDVLQGGAQITRPI